MFLSELPAETMVPSGDQAQCSRFFSKLWTWPLNTFAHRSPVQNGRTSWTWNIHKPCLRSKSSSFRRDQAQCNRFFSTLNILASSVQNVRTSKQSFRIWIRIVKIKLMCIRTHSILRVMNVNLWTPYHIVREINFYRSLQVGETFYSEQFFKLYLPGLIQNNA